jgi:6-pyruvoyltetrahydropterin/6-carboxytetrahydropterin synthase
MVVDLGFFGRVLEETRNLLDHRFLDEIPDLGPATIENLSAWIWHRLEDSCPGLVRVTVHRDSQGDWCAYFGPQR